MNRPHAPLKHLAPGWYAIVMGLAGLSLAWHRATPVLGEGAAAGAMVIGALTALVFVVLAAASATPTPGPGTSGIRCGMCSLRRCRLR